MPFVVSPRCAGRDSGQAVEEVMGIVMANSVRAKHLGRDIMATFRNIAGGEIKEYTRLLAESRGWHGGRRVRDSRLRHGRQAGLMSLLRSPCIILPGFVADDGYPLFLTGDTGMNSCRALPACALSMPRVLAMSAARDLGRTAAAAPPGPAGWCPPLLLVTVGSTDAVGRIIPTNRPSSVTRPFLSRDTLNKSGGVWHSSMPHGRQRCLG